MPIRYVYNLWWVIRTVLLGILQAGSLAKIRPGNTVAPAAPKVVPAHPQLPDADAKKTQFIVPKGTMWARDRSNDSAAAKVRLAHVDQGFLSDCFYQAAVGALAHQKPHVIEKMIARRPDGVEIRLPAGTVKVAHELPTQEGKLIYAAGGGNNVLWPAYLEKAIASQRPEGYKTLNHGGRVQDAFKWITGYRPKTEPQPAGSLLNDLQKRLDAGEAVTLGTRNARAGSRLYRAMRQFGIEPDHSYVAESVYSRDGEKKLRLWNIWGFDHPKVLTESQVNKVFDDVVTDKTRYWINPQR